MTVSIIFEQVDPITVNLRTYLSDRNIDLASDVTEAVFMVKENAADADGSALATKTLVDGITKVPDTSTPVTNDQLSVQFASTDFGTGKMESGKTYYFGVGLKTATTPKFMEPKISDNRIRIDADFIHD